MDKTIITTLIASCTSILSLVFFKPLVDRYFLKFQLKQNYRAEQSKKVKDHIAVHKGILLQTGENLNQRLKNLSKNYDENWMKAEGNYIINNHYLDSTVYRFLAFFGQIKIIEKDLIFIDATRAQKKDLRMLKYFQIFHVIMCDVDLFDGYEYDKNHQTDHFFTSPFYNFSNSIVKNKQIIDYDEFINIKSQIIDKVEIVYKFFDSISPTEERLRCERLKIFHLILIAFINEYGYDYQRTESDKIKLLRVNFGEYKLLKNLKRLVIKFKLNKSFFNPIQEIINEVE